MVLFTDSGFPSFDYDALEITLHEYLRSISLSHSSILEYEYVEPRAVRVHNWARTVLRSSLSSVCDPPVLALPFYAANGPVLRLKSTAMAHKHMDGRYRTKSISAATSCLGALPLSSVCMSIASVESIPSILRYLQLAIGFLAMSMKHQRREVSLVS